MIYILITAATIFIMAVCFLMLFNTWRMNKEIMERRNYVQFEAMREEILYRDREQKVSQDRVEGLCKEYEETFRAMQIMDELEGRQ